MKIEFQDRTWQVDPNEITNRQAQRIHAHTGLSLSKWLKSLAEMEGDPHRFLQSWDALYWLMLQQNDEKTVAIDDVDYPVLRFAEAFMNAMEAGNPAKAAEPDPTLLSPGSAPSPAPLSPKTPSSQGGGSPDG